MWQRKSEYKVTCTTTDDDGESTSTELRSVDVTLPSLTLGHSEVWDPDFGVISLDGGVNTISPLVVKAPIRVPGTDDSVDTTTTVLNQIYALNNSDRVDVEVSLQEVVDGTVTASKTVFASLCKLIEVKVEDVSTNADEVAHVMITLQPQGLTNP